MARRAPRELRRLFFSGKGLSQPLFYGLAHLRQAVFFMLAPGRHSQRRPFRVAYTYHTEANPAGGAEKAYPEKASIPSKHVRILILRRNMV